jgi:hypothetical protein
LDNLHVSKVGLTAAFEPGYERAIVNGLSVAAKVALRLLLLQPNSFHVDNQAQVNFVQNKAVEVLPFLAL